jgi:hypothetical protein
LRSSLPSARDAEERAEAWLRERQATVGGDVLIITGRGRGSVDGIAVVRPAVQRRLSRLRRQGVVAEMREHSPGSFAVTLAPLRAMLTAQRRSKDPPPRPLADPVALSSLEPATKSVLRALAQRTLELLGAPRTDALVNDEMTHQFSRLAAAIAAGPNREARLRQAARAALAEAEDA